MSEYGVSKSGKNARKIRENPGKSGKMKNNRENPGIGPKTAKIREFQFKIRENGCKVQRTKQFIFTFLNFFLTVSDTSAEFWS